MLENIKDIKARAKPDASGNYTVGISCVDDDFNWRYQNAERFTVLATPNLDIAIKEAKKFVSPSRVVEVWGDDIILTLEP